MFLFGPPIFLTLCDSYLPVNFTEKRENKLFCCHIIIKRDFKEVGLSSKGIKVRPDASKTPNLFYNAFNSYNYHHHDHHNIFVAYFDVCAQHIL